VHVIAFIAREPDKAVGSVRLERDRDALARVLIEVMLRQLAENVQNPLVTVEINPDARLRRRRRRRSRRRSCRPPSPFAFNDDIN